MTRVLYETDHGAVANGKPCIAIRGWYVDGRGKRHECCRNIERYADDKTMHVAREKIAEELQRGAA